MSYTSKRGWQDASHVAGPGWEGYVPAGKGFLEYRRRIPGTRRGVVVKAKGPPPGYPQDGLTYRVGFFGHPQGAGSDRVLWFEETRSRIAALDLGDRVVERGYVPAQVAAVEADAAKRKKAHRAARIGAAVDARMARKNPQERRMAKKTKDPYVFVEGRAPDGSYFGANYRTSQLPALFAALRAAGVFDITLDEREVDLREPRKNPRPSAARATFDAAYRAHRAWDTRRIPVAEFQEATSNRRGMPAIHAEEVHKKWRPDRPERLAWKRTSSGKLDAYIGGGSYVTVKPAPTWMYDNGPRADRLVGGPWFVAVIDELGIGGPPKYIAADGTVGFGSDPRYARNVFATEMAAKLAAARYLLRLKRGLR